MINRLHFSIVIYADKPKIWRALWGDKAYRSWAGVFYEGSYAVAENWEVGSTVLFLAPDQSGIYSIIKNHIPNEIMHFEHIGNVVKGKQQPVDDEAKKWTGATEIYRLVQSADNGITLEVEIDVMDEHKDFMTRTFPKALELIRENCG